MTTTATVPAPTEKPTAWVRGRSELGDHIADVVGKLQARFLRDTPDPDAVAALARLRRGIGCPPGFDYSLDEFLAVPDKLIRRLPADDTQAADEEHAAHDAVTLYALHQQSRRERMHVTGRGLGHAVRALTLVADGGADGVRRRFAALGTASTYAESTYHLRGLVTMLRGHQIPLDYGLLADDLYQLLRSDDEHTQHGPSWRARVQAAWGREFFRSAPATDLTGTETDTDADGRTEDSEES